MRNGRIYLGPCDRCARALYTPARTIPNPGRPFKNDVVCGRCYADHKRDSSSPAMDKRELLPDSRPAETRGRVFTAGGAWVPIFCANCGAEGGLVPEQNMTFICYLCAKCAERYGEVAGTMMMPDEVFFERLKQEQIAQHGRYLTEQELAAVVEAGASPLATLLNERRQQLKG